MKTARNLLPPAVADRWIALMRPAFRMRPAYGSEKRIGQLGGVPRLPDGTEWPSWDDQGPLNFVASIDCARLPRNVLDIRLPEDGILNFFWFDDEPGSLDDETPWRKVGRWDPESLVKGSRVIYTPSNVPASNRSTPSEIAPYEFVPLAAKPTMTGPDWIHPAFRAACANLPDSDRAFVADWANRDALMSAIYDLAPPPRHQIGGHALPVQDAVELEVAYANQSSGTTPHDEDSATVNREASKWTPLVQIDFDATDEHALRGCGTLYWLIRTEDLVAKNFRASSFTRQE